LGEGHIGHFGGKEVDTGVNVFPAFRQRPVERWLHIADAATHVHVDMNRLGCDPPPVLETCAVKKIRGTEGFEHQGPAVEGWHRRRDFEGSFADPGRASAVRSRKHLEVGIHRSLQRGSEKMQRVVMR
jgi:hypothetical protein